MMYNIIKGNCMTMDITKIYDLSSKEDKRLKETNDTIIKSMDNIIKKQYQEKYFYNADKHLSYAIALLMLPFNQSYLRNTILTFDELDYFMGMIIRQTDYTIHPLTCGKDSNHALLVPRLDHNKNKYIICPTCGYVQQLS